MTGPADEERPASGGWFATFGAVIVFGLAVLIASGLGLALYYAPTPDHAWDSVQYILSTVPAGVFLRGLHYWGTRVVIVMLAAHLVRVVLSGGYRKPQQWNWIAGVLLLQVVLAFAMTGLLLPWDEGAYWATVVRIGIASLTPFAGATVATILRGGPEIGAMTLPRWYALHVIVLPMALFLLLAVHLAWVRRAPFARGDAARAIRAAAPYFPTQAARDLVAVAIALVVLVALAWHGAPPLDPPADPTATDYLPRPEWYFAGLFQFVKYFPGRVEVLGAIVIPGAAMTALALIPWLDRGRTRAWRDRRPVLMLFGAGALSIAVLTAMGMMDRVTRQGDSWNVRELAGVQLIATDRCTRCHKTAGVADPIAGGHLSRPADWLAAHVADPEMIAPGLREPPTTNARDTQAILAALAHLRAAQPPALSPGDAAAMLLVTRNCLGCHTVGAVGGKEGPNLTHVGAKIDEAHLAMRIRDPLTVKPDAEMPAFGTRLKPDEIQTIAGWLAQRK